MKFLVIFLAIINAALFLWATGHDPGESTPGAGYPVVNAQSMALLSEVEAAHASAADSVERCARIGPFHSSSVAAVAAQKLEAMSLTFSRRTVKSREIRAHRVFLGPFDSDSALAAQRRLLDASGISEYYVKAAQDAGHIISLGLFSQRDGAAALQRRLAGKGVQTRLRSEDRMLAPSYWLEIDPPAAGGELAASLADASWGENQARMRRYPCP